MLTTRDLLADAVDLCAKLARVLKAVYLSSLLVAPAVLEAATVQGGEVSEERRQPVITPASGWFLAVVCY